LSLSGQGNLIEVEPFHLNFQVLRTEGRLIEFHFVSSNQHGDNERRHQPFPHICLLVMLWGRIIWLALNFGWVKASWAASQSIILLFIILILNLFPLLIITLDNALNSWISNPGIIGFSMGIPWFWVIILDSLVVSLTNVA